MRFRLRTLIFITFAAGLLTHAGACLQGHSISKLTQLLLVFYFGASIVILSPIMVTGIVGRRHAYLGVIFGAITWGSLLYLISTWEGEVFRFIWLHASLLLSTSVLTLLALSQREEPDCPAKHSMEQLLRLRKGRREKTTGSSHSHPH